MKWGKSKFLVGGVCVVVLFNTALLVQQILYGHLFLFLNAVFIFQVMVDSSAFLVLWYI